MYYVPLCTTLCWDLDFFLMLHCNEFCILSFRLNLRVLWTFKISLFRKINHYSTAFITNIKLFKASTHIHVTTCGVHWNRTELPFREIRDLEWQELLQTHMWQELWQEQKQTPSSMWWTPQAHCCWLQTYHHGQSIIWEEFLIGVNGPVAIHLGNPVIWKHSYSE